MQLSYWMSLILITNYINTFLINIRNAYYIIYGCIFKNASENVFTSTTYGNFI